MSLALPSPGHQPTKPEGGAVQEAPKVRGVIAVIAASRMIPADSTFTGESITFLFFMTEAFDGCAVAALKSQRCAFLIWREIKSNSCQPVLAIKKS
jgi:hypothetical protein